MTDPYLLYIHIPFCSRKCPYCDFNTYAVARAPEHDYVGALLKEMSQRSRQHQFSNRTLKSMFFGGGTPSFLSSGAITSVIEHALKLSPYKAPEEITVEANPGDLPLEKLRDYKKAGVTRVSLGAQSFQPAILATLGRTHSRDDIFRSVENCISAGITDISIDLIFGAPGQTVEILKKDLDEAVKLPINHISTYSLTYEAGTPFFQSVGRGIIKPLDDDLVAEMSELIESELGRNNYSRYEISNYAKNGRISIHNSGYWNGTEYFGIGAGAHSFSKKVAPRRWSNIASPDAYIKKIERNEEVVSWREELKEQDLEFEFFYLGLRKTEGVSRRSYKENFGRELEVNYGDTIEELVSSSLAILDQSSLRLTSKGLLIADSIFLKFLK